MRRLLYRLNLIVRRIRQGRPKEGQLDARGALRRAREVAESDELVPVIWPELPDLADLGEALASLEGDAGRLDGIVLGALVREHPHVLTDPATRGGLAGLLARASDPQFAAAFLDPTQVRLPVLGVSSPIGGRTHLESLVRVAAALEAGDDGVALEILFRRYGDEQRFLAALTDRRLMRHAQVKPAALAGLLLSQDRDIREAAIGLISSLR